MDGFDRGVTGDGKRGGCYEDKLVSLILPADKPYEYAIANLTLPLNSYSPVPFPKRVSE